MMAEAPAATRMRMNKADLDPVEPGTGQLTAGGKMPLGAQAGKMPDTGMSKRAASPQEALDKGDPKLLEALRKRSVGAAAAKGK